MARIEGFLDAEGGSPAAYSHDRISGGRNSTPVERRFERFARLGRGDRTYLQRLQERARPVEARRLILSEKDPCESLHVLTAGWALEFRTLATGERQVLRVRLPGEVAGAECIVYGTSLQSMQGLTRCAVAEIPRQEYSCLHRQHPGIVTALYAMSAYERAILQEWAFSLGSRKARSRIAHLLLEIDERCRASGLARDGTTPLPLTQQDLADCLGLTLPYLNRVLNSMRRSRLIELKNQTLEILDRCALAECAGFEHAYLRPFTGTKLDPR